MALCMLAPATETFMRFQREPISRIMMRRQNIELVTAINLVSNNLHIKFEFQVNCARYSG
jgi:hypothetical protein